LAGMENGVAAMENRVAVSQKTKNRAPENFNVFLYLLIVLEWSSRIRFRKGDCDIFSFN